MRFFAVISFFLALLPHSAQTQWTTLESGLELGSFLASQKSPVGDSRITILRIDPDLWELVVVGTSWDNESRSGTARDWCESHQLTAAINAGMFGEDFSSHIGYLGSRGHVNSSHVNSYMSVAAFDPRNKDEHPEFRIFDLDDPTVTTDSILQDYLSVVQNLRLIKRNGENRWSQQDKMWSEAALGEDGSGKLLFIFCRSPFTMHDLNQELLSLGIDLVAAQHLEGGPEAQLFLHTDNLTQELFGSYETSFQENDDNDVPWPVPNVLGIRRRTIKD